MADIIEIGGHGNMTVSDCLAMSTRQQDSYEQVLVLAWSKEGELIHHCSGMDKAEANWLLDAAKQDLINGSIVTFTAESLEQI